jgi:hypothetical protein
MVPLPGVVTPVRLAEKLFGKGRDVLDWRHGTHHPCPQSVSERTRVIPIVLITRRSRRVVRAGLSSVGIRPIPREEVSPVIHASVEWTSACQRLLRPWRYS